MISKYRRTFIVSQILYSVLTNIEARSSTSKKIMDFKLQTIVILF